MTNLKKEILTKLIQYVEDAKSVSKKTPVKFSSKTLADNIEGCYKPSVSREIRQLKALKYINYELIERIEGEYKLIPINSEKYTRKALLTELNESLKSIEFMSRKNNLDEIKNLFKKHGRNRDLQETSTESQTP